jgi:hypothetical protein
VVGRELQRQATALAYVDVIHVVAVAAACMVPVAFLFVKGHRPAGAAPVH